MGFIATFYSYKGGVGRSMAVANIAVILAQKGLRTLAVDFDLEAPGLQRYFLDGSRRDNDLGPGLIDLLTDAARMRSRDLDWRDCINHFELDVSEPLSILTSGLQDGDYATRVLEFNWRAFFENQEGGAYIERLRDEWRREFDVVLVDSRTGLTDTGGICTVQLPDVLVPVFTANFSSVRGAREVAERAQRARQNLAYDRPPLLVFPLPSRFDSRTEYRESREWLTIFAKELGGFYDNWLRPPVTPLQMLERTKLPYVAYFSFGEKLPVITEGTSDPEGLGYAYSTAGKLIAGHFENAEEIIFGAALPAEESLEHPAKSVLADWEARAAMRSDQHYAIAQRLLRLNLAFGVLIVTLSAVVATAVFSTLGGTTKALLIAVGIISLLVGILASVQTFLRLSERAERHRGAAMSWGAIRHEIAQARATPDPFSVYGDPKLYLDDLQRRMDEIVVTEPALGDHDWRQKQAAELSHANQKRGSDPRASTLGNTGPLGQPRGIGFGILIFLVTFGFYSWYWVYKTQEEMKQRSGEGLGGVLGLVVWIIVGAVSAFVIPSEVGKMYQKDGQQPPMTGWTGLWLFPGAILIIPAIVWFVKVQGALNRYWAGRATAAPA